MNIGVALVVVVFFLGGQADVEGGVLPSTEACQERLAKIPNIIAAYNESAENPVKITHYSAACLPFTKAPQGKEV